MVLIIAGTAIIIASNVPLRKIFSIEIFASFFSEFESNFISDNSRSYKNPSRQILKSLIEFGTFSHSNLKFVI